MLTPPQDLKAIFFDLDNVLVFSEVAHFNAWQMVMAELNVNPDLIDFQSLIGIDDVTQSMILKDKFKLGIDANTIWLMKRATFSKLVLQGFSHPQGREAFLQTASMFIRAVVSSSGREVIQQVLQNEKIDTHFDFIIGHEDCVKHKPHPLPYLLALEKANVAPSQALVIEDSPSGIKAALGANIPVVGIFKDQKEADLIDNVRYFNSFSEINTWLTQTTLSQKALC